MKPKHPYGGMVSSDWNQCLAPCGPFDAIAFRYPQLRHELDPIFHRYTSNRMTLAEAAGRIASLLPAPLSKHEMDDYLLQHFKTYPGVVELITWCARNRIIFMINTTGPLGYFQRAMALNLLPALPVLSAHPGIRYRRTSGVEPLIYELLEITDKGVNTAKAADHFGIPYHRIIVVGDSGGDGPHFKWAGGAGANSIGCMAKPSLINYCRDRNLAITHLFGHTYVDGEARAPEKENRSDFSGLKKVFGQLLGV